MPATGTYRIKRDRLEKLLLANASLEQLAEDLDIHRTTACRWKKRFYKEIAEMTDQRAIEIRHEHIGSTLHRFRMLEAVALKKAINGDSWKEQKEAIYAIVTLKRETTALLDRTKIFEQQPRSYRVEYMGKHKEG